VSNPFLTEREEGQLRDMMFFESFSTLHPSLLHHRCVKRLWFDSLAHAYSDALMLIHCDTQVRNSSDHQLQSVCSCSHFVISAVEINDL
jgi:hypothetical protein